MKLAIKIFGYAILIYVAFAGGLFLAQRDMMYFPNYSKPMLKDTGIIGLEEFTVKTEDGLTLFSWYKAPASGKPVILWFHGNASNVGWSAARLKPFVAAGYGVLIAEYRGYSTNPGKASEKGFYQDGRAFMNWLKARGISENNIILYGESIGSGVAVQLATEYPQINTLILEAPFTNTIALAKNRYFFLPVNLMLKDRYDNLSKISSIKAPLIVLHGTDDSVVPYAMGKKLFDAAPEPKTMITLEGGNHNDLIDYRAGEKVLSALSE
jgi:fermentation-respiration switch protein FrsA (DUF1100 family)